MIEREGGGGKWREEVERRGNESKESRAAWKNSGAIAESFRDERDNRSPGLIDSILPRPFQSLAAPTLHKNAADWSVATRLRFVFVSASSIAFSGNP